IRKGEIILVEDKVALMTKLGKKSVILRLTAPLTELPGALAADGLGLSDGGSELVYTYDGRHEGGAVPRLLDQLRANGIAFTDLRTRERSLEEIFVSLVKS